MNIFKQAKLRKEEINIQNKSFIYIDNLPNILPEEDLQKLLFEVNRGSIEAKKKVATHNVRIVLKVVNHLENINYDKEELFAVGNVGLLKAIDSYDINRGVAFYTYAKKCITNEIFQFLIKLKKYQSIEYIEENIEYLLKSKTTFEDKYEQIEVYKILRKLVEQLPEMQREIILLYFGFYEDSDGITQKEIADMFNVTQCYISRLITKILNNLKRKLEQIEVIEPHTKAKKVRLK